MVTNKRLLDIKSELETSDEFFSKIRALIHDDDDLSSDLDAAPEFFDEMSQIVDELMRYRGLDAFKNEIRSVIPEAFAWHRGKRSIWRGIWDDIVDVAK